MKEMIENFNRYQIINESTGNVIKVSHRWRIFHHVTDILDAKCKRLQFHMCANKIVRFMVIQWNQVFSIFL